MTIRAGVGTSKARNPASAAREAVKTARAAGKIEKTDLVILFASINYDQQSLLDAVREETGRVKLIGCSVEGTIANEGSCEDPFTMLVALVESDELRFDTVLVTNLKAEPEACGASIAKALQPAVKNDALALMLFPDGLTVNFDRLTEGLKILESPNFLPIVGGTAGDDWKFKQTYQFIDDRVVSDGVVATLISGSAKIAFAVNHGCVPLGAERKITKSIENRILEIDNRPALDVMREYLDLDEKENWSKAIVNLPLGFKAPDFMKHKDEFIIRYVGVKDDVEKSITIPTTVTEGTSVWMTRRDFKKISDGNESAIASLQEQMGGEQAKLVLQFDCAGRGKVILRDEEKQRLLDRMREGIGQEAAWLGFHAYGEIAPVGTNNTFHNFTAVIAALY